MVVRGFKPQGGCMKRYETIFIIDPDLSDEGRQPVLERVTGVISSQDGFLARIDEWGLRKLAYEIKKKNRGYYILLDYCGMGPLVDELERFFKIDDRVIKYITILLDENADVEKLKAEIAEAEAKKIADQEEQGSDLQTDEPEAMDEEITVETSDKQEE